MHLGALSLLSLAHRPTADPMSPARAEEEIMRHSLLFVVLLLGCAPSGGGGGAACQPGEVGACACLSSGERGEWICNEDGEFGACSCEPDAGQPDMAGPDATQADARVAADDGGVVCVADCAGRQCGDDGCGGGCGDCAEGEDCRADGRCAAPPPGCGDDRCGADEDCASCPVDCGSCCGNGACEARLGETCGACAADCGCSADQRCEAAECVDVCQPACGGGRCGDDGCGGSCAACGGDFTCVDGACVSPDLVLIYDDDVPIRADETLEVVALFEGPFVNGRVEDVHGRRVAVFQTTGRVGEEIVRIGWQALNQVEPLDGGRRERRALFGVYDRGGATIRLPFTVRVLCAASQLCLGECIARAAVCDRSCPAGCGGAEACVDRACTPLVDGVALAGLRPRITGLRPAERVPRGIKGEPLAVWLDRPAPVGGVTVRLESLDPAVSVPAEVRVPPGDDHVDVLVDAGATTHGAGIIARLGPQARYGEVRVLPPVLAGAEVVINEVDYNQPGVDTEEFVELYNPTRVAQPVGHLRVVFGNGEDDGDAYLTVSLSEQPPLPAGGYLLVANPSLAPAPGLSFPEDSMQGGRSDGVRLVDAATGEVVDSMAYDGFLLGTTEGRLLSADLRSDRVEGFSRCPNGVDTQSTGDDFARVPPTPGAANVCP